MQTQPNPYPAIDELVEAICAQRQATRRPPDSFPFAITTAAMGIGAGWLVAFSAYFLVGESATDGTLSPLDQVTLVGDLVVALSVAVPGILVARGHPLGLRFSRAVSAVFALAALAAFAASATRSWAAPAWVTAISLALLGGVAYQYRAPSCTMYAVFRQKLRIGRRRAKARRAAILRPFGDGARPRR